MNQKLEYREENYDDFRYMEFIRKPQKIKDKMEGIECVALDYFDLIYMKEARNFQECMTMDNDIPCEAYQGIGLFRKKDGEEEKEEDDPFQLSQELPFFAVLQVTFTPGYYRSNSGKSADYELKNLQEVIRGAGEEYSKRIITGDLSKFDVKTAVYYTVNTMDFCVVIKTNRLEFPLFLSNEIKNENTPDQKYKKYAVYTMMGIYKNFENLPEYEFIGDKTALVVRVHLRRSLCREWENIIREIIEKENEERKHIITDTHSIPGRYDLTIRVNGKDDILSVLPGIVQAIMESFANENGEISSNVDIAKEGAWNSLDYIIAREYAEYLNVRIFSDCGDCFGDVSGQWEDHHDEQSRPISEEAQQTGLVKDLEENYKSVVDLIEEFHLEDHFRGYMSKLHQIVHICIALHCRYDTNISIVTLSYYLVNFMALLRMNIEFLDGKLVPLKAIGMNFVLGINYLQQFIKVVTSVNVSSFEAPKYETEKDECCFVKLPIAYTQFLTGIFKKYYEDRNIRAIEHGDDQEVQFFPEYIPLVIPYMQNGNSKYMMTTLFAQNMSDQWDKIKEPWKEHIHKNKVPMFIICQDMDDYRNVSSVISSSLHEIGHYCNGMTRKQRNEDLIHIFSEEIAKEIVKKCTVISGVNYQLAVYALEVSELLQEFKDSVYEGLTAWFLQVMEEELDYPESAFQSKFLEKFRRLTNVYADCGNPKIVDEELLTSFLDEIQYTFNLEIPEKEDKLEYIIKDAIPKRCQEILNTLKCGLGKCGEEIPFLDEIRQYAKVAGEICEKMKKGNEEEVLNRAWIIKELTEKIKLKPYCQWNKQQEASWELRTIRRIALLLQEVQKCIGVLLRGMQKRNILSGINYENGCGELKEIIVSKDNLLKKICADYRKKCQIVQSDIFQGGEGFAEVYQRMNLYPDSKDKDIEEILNQALMGLPFPEENIINAGNCYKESIADIVMCVNLNLSTEEYFVKMNELYHEYGKDGKTDTARLVIVAAYLIMGRDNVKQYKVQAQREEWLHIKWHEKFKALLKSEHLSRNIKEVIGNYSMVMEKRLFDLTMSRVSEIIDRIMLVENADELNFVKESLGLREKNHRSDEEDNVQSGLWHRVQHKEIEFILKYYYQNRRMYAAKSGKEIVAGDYEGGDSHVYE